MITARAGLAGRVDVFEIEQFVALNLYERRKLSREGWRCLVVWECELRNEGPVAAKLLRFLGE
jgi:G:T-mismatch repair DNA endonuclease (very short patch repair protein)